MSNSENTRALLSAAVEAAQSAYAPYSKFKVGAAVLTQSGASFTGCNIENVSFGLTICAERVAVFKAVSAGETEIELLALSSPGGAAPCGACRQVLQEFNPTMTVILGDALGREVSRTSLKDLLPVPFGPELKKV